MKIDYADINARALGHILSAKKHLPAIDGGLKSLLELRVSQINGCGYCVDLHAEEARHAGESQQRLDCLVVWRECGLFSDSEMAALAWAESLTLIATAVDIEAQAASLASFYSEEEIVDITYVVALMNCLNRISLSLGDQPENRQDQSVG